ncbi:MAG: 30S ribosomal protein S13 [Spirochaetes bacterium]|nr:30S ribosomal protein S13 [Spirochaetota bacterium]
MARIAGVDLPKNKRIFIGLTYIFGIGHTRAADILNKSKIDPLKKVSELTDEEITLIRKEIEKYKVEGDLRTEVAMNVKRLKDIQSYKGFRHIKNLPVRGQRTHTNARTHKGSRPSVGGKKKVAATATSSTTKGKS